MAYMTCNYTGHTSAAQILPTGKKANCPCFRNEASAEGKERFDVSACRQIIDETTALDHWRLISELALFYLDLRESGIIGA
jgi:hypothetical protein